MHACMHQNRFGAVFSTTAGAEQRFHEVNRVSNRGDSLVSELNSGATIGVGILVSLMRALANIKRESSGYKA